MYGSLLSGSPYQSLAAAKVHCDTLPNKMETNMCKSYKEATNHMDELRNGSLAKVDMIMKQIQNVLPPLPTMEIGKRALDFVADLSKSLFGFATSSDIKLLAEHIQAPKARSSTMSRAFT